MSNVTSELVHGLWTPLANKVAMVKTWPGINPDDVDVAVATAMSDGTMAGYEAEVGNNTRLDAVVTIYRESLSATRVYACMCMCEAWGKAYSHAPVFDRSDAVKRITEGRPFLPNRIVIEVVDFGANSKQQNNDSISCVQRAQAPHLADFALIYNAAQSPQWGLWLAEKQAPYPVLGGLLANESHQKPWSHSPCLIFDKNLAGLSIIGTELSSNRHAMPVIRQYSKP